MLAQVVIGRSNVEIEKEVLTMNYAN